MVYFHLSSCMFRRTFTPVFFCPCRGCTGVHGHLEYFMFRNKKFLSIETEDCPLGCLLFRIVYLRVLMKMKGLQISTSTSIFAHMLSYRFLDCLIVSTFKRLLELPWLVWLSGLSTSLRTGRSQVWFPVRAHAWVLGQVPNLGRARGNQLIYLSCVHWCFSAFLSPFLPL